MFFILSKVILYLKWRIKDTLPSRNLVIKLLPSFMLYLFQKYLTFKMGSRKKILFNCLQLAQLAFNKTKFFHGFRPLYVTYLNMSVITKTKITKYTKTKKKCLFFKTETVEKSLKRLFGFFTLFGLAATLRVFKTQRR